MSAPIVHLTFLETPASEPGKLVSDLTPTCPSQAIACCSTIRTRGLGLGKRTTFLWLWHVGHGNGMGHGRANLTIGNLRSEGTNIGNLAPPWSRLRHSALGRQNWSVTTHSAWSTCFQSKVDWNCNIWVLRCCCWCLGEDAMFFSIWRLKFCWLRVGENSGELIAND